MKKLLYFTLGCVAGAIAITTYAAAIYFKDVKPKDWFYQPVVNVTNLGIMTTAKDGYFKPGAIVTRADLATTQDKLYQILKGNTDRLAALIANAKEDTAHIKSDIAALDKRIKIAEDKINGLPDWNGSVKSLREDLSSQIKQVDGAANDRDKKIVASVEQIQISLKAIIDAINSAFGSHFSTDALQTPISF